MSSHPTPPRPAPTGKFFLSAGDKQLALLCHVPKELAAAKGVNKKDWVDAVLKPLQGAQVWRAGVGSCARWRPAGRGGERRGGAGSEAGCSAAALVAQGACGSTCRR